MEKTLIRSGKGAAPCIGKGAIEKSVYSGT